MKITIGGIGYVGSLAQDAANELTRRVEAAEKRTRDLTRRVDRADSRPSAMPAHVAHQARLDAFMANVYAQARAKGLDVP